MYCYKLIHEYKIIGHKQIKKIGVYSSIENVNLAINSLKSKPGFKDIINGFKIKRVYRFIKPKNLDYTHWNDGYDSYTYVKNIDRKISCDQSLLLLEHFAFLVKDFGFNFDKVELGDYKSKVGKLYFYGPYNCYSFYIEGLSINFLNLVQRGDWDITITDTFMKDQNFLNEGMRIDQNLIYDWNHLAILLKREIIEKNEVFGKKIQNKISNTI